MNITKIILVILIFVLLGLAIWKYKYVIDLYKDYIKWIINEPILSVLVTIPFYILIIITFIPSSIISAGLGYAFTSATDNTLYGILISFSISFISSICGALLVQFIGRWLLRDFIKKIFKGNKKFKGIYKALEKNGK